MSTSDFSSAIDRAPGARSKYDEKSEVLIRVVEIMLTVNYSHSGDSATLIGNFTPHSGLRFTPPFVGGSREAAPGARRK